MSQACENNCPTICHLYFQVVFDTALYKSKYAAVTEILLQIA